MCWSAPIAYAHARGIPPGRLIASPPPLGIPDVAAADLDYGALYDLRYALEALQACYPGTVVPDCVTEAVRQGTGVRPRKLWHYSVAPGGGELGTAAAQLGIGDQIGKHSALTWDDLKSQGLVSVGICGAPPQGYWHDLTKQEFGDIFKPWP
jgi:hypothetical protein